jgi:signal peptidase II
MSDLTRQTELLESAAVSHQRRSVKALVGCLVAVAALTAADLGSKAWALEHLSKPSTNPSEPVCERDELGRLSPQRVPQTPFVLIDGYLELRYAENCGAAFGFMRDMPSVFRKGVFYVAAIGAVILLMWMFVSGRGGKLFAISVPLIVSGALGNLVDRVRFGYVVDFVRAHIDNQWAYPTFNVADAWITIGVLLILVEGFLDGRKERRAEAVTSEAGAA